MAQIGWIDTHTHLVYHDQALLSEQLHYAYEHGVREIVAISLDESECHKHMNMAKKQSQLRIHVTCGAHPADVYKWSEEKYSSFMTQLAKLDVVAIGEIGLDYYWDKEHHELQKKRFIDQIHLANERQLPILVHCRDAFEDCLVILKQHPPLSGGIMHCYSGSKEMAVEFLKVGMDISLAGPLTFKNAKTPKEVASMVPLDRLHIETDAPYLTPHPFRGQRNHTGLVHYVGEELSRIKYMNESDVKNQLALNFERIFVKK